MARKIIGCEELNAAIAEVLEEYALEVDSEIRDAAKAAGNTAVKTLRATSPKGSGAGKKGHYADGWTMKEEKARYAFGFTIYNSKKPGLAHLLEHGHANRGGGRTEGIKHISPVETQAIKDFEQEIRKRLSE